MILGTIIQQPGEHLDYDVDYTKFFAKEALVVTSDSTSIDKISTTTLPTTEIDKVGPSVVSIRNTDTVVKIWIANVSADENYKITITMTTSSGRVKIDELILIGEDF